MLAFLAHCLPLSKKLKLSCSVFLFFRKRIKQEGGGGGGCSTFWTHFSTALYAETHRQAGKETTRQQQRCPSIRSIVQQGSRSAHSEESTCRSGNCRQGTSSSSNDWSIVDQTTTHCIHKSYMICRPIWWAQIPFLKSVLVPVTWRSESSHKQRKWSSLKWILAWQLNCRNESVERT